MFCFLGWGVVADIMDALGCFGIRVEIRILDLAVEFPLCVFIPSPVREGSTLFGDHRGSILSNRAETSQEG